MFISIKKDRNLRVVCLVESYRDENGKNKKLITKEIIDAKVPLPVNSDGIKLISIIIVKTRTNWGLQ